MIIHPPTYLHTAGRAIPRLGDFTRTRDHRPGGGRETEGMVIVSIAPVISGKDMEGVFIHNTRVGVTGSRG